MQPTQIKIKSIDSYYLSMHNNVGTKNFEVPHPFVLQKESFMNESNICHSADSACNMHCISLSVDFLDCPESNGSVDY